jgi:hypothetical protein
VFDHVKNNNYYIDWSNLQLIIGTPENILYTAESDQEFVPDMVLTYIRALKQGYQGEHMEDKTYTVNNTSFNRTYN